MDCIRGDYLMKSSSAEVPLFPTFEFFSLDQVPRLILYCLLSIKVYISVPLTRTQLWAILLHYVMIRCCVGVAAGK